MQGVSSAAAGVSRHRFTRHLNKLLSNAVTNVFSSGEVCPELNELGFKIDKVSTYQTRQCLLHCCCRIAKLHIWKLKVISTELIVLLLHMW